MFFFVKKGNRGIKEDPLSKNRSTKTISYIFLWLRYLFEKGSSLCQLPAGQQTVREPSEHVVVGDLKLLILILIFFYEEKNQVFCSILKFNFDINIRQVHRFKQFNCCCHYESISGTQIM